MGLLSELAPKTGAKHYQKRIGRGRGSGLGQTAGKGGKGQTARSGGKIRRGFEGGQTPLIRRLPKFGFNNTAFEIKYSVVNLAQLNKIDGEITPQILKEMGLVHSFPVKVLGNGKLNKALIVKAHAFSETAKASIEKSGGKTEIVKR